MAYKKILFRRDTSANWTSQNPVLWGGEIGLETNTNKIKLGDGSTAWNSLNYFYGSLDNANLSDISDVTITDIQTGDVLRWNGSAWINDPINLSTDTVGAYVESLVAGTGVTITNNTGEGATPTVAIGQAIGTSASVTFGQVETTGDVVVGGNLTVNGTSTTLNTETLAVEDNYIILNANVTGSPSLDAGVFVERGTSSNVSLRWNETTDKWELSSDGSAYSPITTTETLETRFAQETLHKPARLATTTVLPNSPTYTAGSSTSDGGTGLLAKLTATTYGRLNIDDTQVVTGNRVLVKNQANAVHNGIYEVTVQGGASQYWELTRADDMNGYYEGQVMFGEQLYIASGLVNGLQTFACSSIGSQANNVHIVGTDEITFEQISGIVTIQAGNGLTSTNNALNITVGSGLTVGPDELDLGPISQSDLSSSVTTNKFVTDVIRDGYGRVTGIQSASVGIVLGTETTGNYVESLVAGTGVTVTNNSGESATPTIAIGQDVSTSASVQFAALSASAITGNATSATQLQTSRTIELTGDVTGSVSFNGTTNASISTTIQPNSVALGTDTTGNYMSDVVGGNGVTVTHTPGEGSSATIAIGQTVGTSSSVQFAAVTAPLIGNASTASALQTARTISLSGDISGSVSFDGSGNVDITTSVQPNAVALGTDTTGNYVSGVSAGTGISVSHTPGEGSTATITNAGVTSVNGSTGAITGVVTTADSGTVTSGMIADGTIVNGDINASAAIALSKLATGTAAQVVLANSSGVPTYTTLSGDVTISDSGVVTIAANSVALGTDTTGSYVQSLVAGTGITLSNNSGESATPTIAVGQDIATSASVTFAKITTTGNVVVGGNLEVTGTTTTVNQTSLNISDPLIYLNGGSEVTDPDLGIAGNYNDGTYRHAGLFSDASDSHTFKFFKGLTVEPTAPINTAHASYTPADVSANTYTSTVSTGTAPLSVSSSTVVTNLNAQYLNGQAGSYYAPLNSPTLVTPNLGTPSAATLTNATGLPISTGVSGLGTGVATFLGTPSSANLASAVTDETGSGALVFANSPTLTTPNLGTPSALTLTNATGLPVSGIVASTSASVGVGTIELGHATDTTIARVSAGRISVEGVNVVTASSTDTLTNKTLTSAVTTGGVTYNGSTTGSTVLQASASASGTITLPAVTGTVVTTGDTGTVTSTMIADGTIVNADISSTAAIDLGKLADVSTNAQTASYTLVIGDKNKIVEMNVASANNLTVPLNSSVAFPVGSQINVLQTGAGQTTVVATGGVTINGTPGLKLRAQWSYATLVKRATDTWVLVGDISA